MKKRIIIIIIILVVIAAAFLGGRELLLVSGLKNKELISAAWSIGGGMTGGHSSIEIKRDGQNAVIVTESQEWHDSDLIRVTYTVSADVLDGLKQLIIAAKVPVLEKRGMSDMIAYDADTYHFRCTFEGNHYYSVSEYQKKTSDEARKLLAVRDYLYSITKGEGITEIIPENNPDNE